MNQNDKLLLCIEIIFLLITILFLTILFLGSKARKLFLHEQLLDHIIWIRKHYLYSFVSHWQKELLISERYCINSEREIAYAKKILSIFSDFLTSKYFSKELQPIRSKYVVSGEQFFARMLWIYLDKHSCENNIGENSIREKQMSQPRYGDSYSESFDTTYSLTPFGIVYYKLYYICFLFLGESPIFNKNGTLFQKPDASFIKEILDSATITISYRQEL